VCVCLFKVESATEATRTDWGHFELWL